MDGYFLIFINSYFAGRFTLLRWWRRWRRTHVLRLAVLAWSRTRTWMLWMLILLLGILMLLAVLALLMGVFLSTTVLVGFLLLGLFTLSVGFFFDFINFLRLLIFFSRLVFVGEDRTLFSSVNFIEYLTPLLFFQSILFWRLFFYHIILTHKLI